MSASKGKTNVSESLQGQKTDCQSVLVGQKIVSEPLQGQKTDCQSVLVMAKTSCQGVLAGWLGTLSMSVRLGFSARSMRGAETCSGHRPANTMRMIMILIDYDDDGVR